MPTPLPVGAGPKPINTPSVPTYQPPASNGTLPPDPKNNPLAGNFDPRANPWAIPGQAPQTGPTGNTDPNAGINYQPGQNGYAGQYQIDPNATNPYQAGLQSGYGYLSNLQGAIPGMQQQANQNTWNAMSSLGNYQQSVTGPGSYPTYPNAAGAGTNSFSGTPGAPIPAMNGLGDGGGGSDPSNSDTAHGFNPWSLTGEAMSRR